MAATDTLIDVRDIIARIHDARMGHEGRVQVPLSNVELAALRDCVRRLNDVNEEIYRKERAS